MKNKTNILFIIVLVIFVYFKINTTKCQPGLNFNRTSTFIENKIGEYSYFYQKNTSLNNSKLAFEEFLYNVKNHDMKLNIAKYYSENTSLNENTNFSHPNICVGSFNNFFANFPMSHSKWKDFYVNTGKPDAIGMKKNQFMSTKLFLYNYHDNFQFILNKKFEFEKLIGIKKDEILKDIVNKQKFQVNYKQYLEVKKDIYIKEIYKNYKK